MNTKIITEKILSFAAKVWFYLKPVFAYLLSKLKYGKNKHNEKYKQSPWYGKLLIIAIDLFLCFVLYLIIVDINLFWLFGKSPGLSSINHPKHSYATEVYSADGVLIGKLFRENRTPVAYNEISPLLIKTLIYTEDERFYKHIGIDFKGLLAAAKDMTKGDARGASTITQQLVKNLFKTRVQYSTGLLGYIPGVRLIIMKSKEWITAVKIEMFYTKQEILTLYLNTVDFGSNAYGIKTAAKTYFKTTPARLTIEQCATLVGLLKATTTYNPKVNPKNSLKRRNIVLQNLLSHKMITQSEYDSISAIPIKLNFNIEKYSDGQAFYFREAIVNNLKDWCEANNVDIYSDGLKIYTTIDTRMQKYAEEAVEKQMKRVQQQFKNHWSSVNPWQDENHIEIKGFIENIARKTEFYKYLSNRYPDRPDSVDYFMNLPHKLKVFDYKEGSKEMVMSTMDSIRYMVSYMHCGFVAMEPNTGYVKCWVGDINFDFWQYDKVLSKRQPGSTFKLFVYTAAFNKGLGPCDMRIDQPVQWDLSEYGEPEIWEPINASATFSGATVSLKNAFARSINSIAVQVAQETGIPEIVKTAHAMGIKSDLDEIPSVCLGSSDVSLLELVDSYCTVVNEGRQKDPVLVTHIEDNNGKVIYRYSPAHKQVLTYQTAFLMTQMLLGGMSEPGGTTQNLWSFDVFKYNTDFGGKTGTSSNHSDAWFVGVTPNLVGGAWVGGEYRCIHFRTGELGEGSKTALPVFGYFMEKVLADNSLSIYRAKFPKPTHEIEVPYSCQTAWKKAEPDSTLSDSTLIQVDSSGIPASEPVPEEIIEQ